MAMWNVSGDDIQRAKVELQNRRAAIQAAYDNGMKQVEAELSDLEAFERTAVNIVSLLKGDDAVSAPVAEPPSPPPAEPVAAASAGESDAPPHAEAAAEHGGEPEPEPGARPGAAERGASRWRMRLGNAEGTR